MSSPQGVGGDGATGRRIAGSTVLVPAGVPHTFGNAGPGPSRFIIILPARLDELISVLHEAAPAEHLAIYRRFQSELLE